MSVTGDRIKECRLRNKLTQADVAAHLGIGKQAVYKYETGAVTNIPLDKVIAMAALFGTTPEYLAGWSDTEENPENEQRDYEDQQRLEALHQNPRLGLLFDRTRKMSAADVETMLAVSASILKELDGDE